MALSFSEFKASEGLPEQRALFTKCFPENAGSSVEKRAHYDWKFREFPASPASYEFAAQLDGQLAGYYAAIPYRYSLRGQQFNAGMVCDVMTDPGHQGKGIFTKLGAYATQSLKDASIGFTTGYPIRPWVIPGHLKVGWKVAFKLPIYIRFLKMSAALRSKNLGWAAPIFNFLLLFFRGIQRAFTPFDSSYRIEVQNRADFSASNSFEPFFQRWSQQQNNFLIKSKEFLLWRTGAPETTYYFVGATRGEEQTAFAVVRRVELEKIPCLAILDLMVLQEHSACLPSVQEALVDLAKRVGAELIVSMMSPTTARRLNVGRSGFVRSPKVFSLIIKKLREDIPDSSLFAEENWNLFWIDSDDL